MKAELYVHLMELIHESERRAEQHPNPILRETYRQQAELLKKTLQHYEEVGEDPKLEAAIQQLKIDEEEKN